ncbi:hypothetical protein Tco_0892925 [Tanacetum coccineum]|uniref:Uncharacterized protein n=1 Tax=Tanacetum coccineum TaxID=301880 RepID=A0ABQ5C8M8_9ASTR
MLQSPPVRRALSSRLKLRHLRKVRVQRKDADTSFEIGPHAPRLFDKSRFSSILINPKVLDLLGSANTFLRSRHMKRVGEQLSSLG